MEALSMAILSHLAYEGWEKEVFPVRRFEINASLPSQAALRSKARHGFSEMRGWARCAWRRIERERARNTPPGGRWPRMLDAAYFFPPRKRHSCSLPGHRVWTMSQWLHGWYEKGPVSTRWHSTNVLVAVSQNTVAIAFRGSTDARHAVTNIQPLTRDDEGLRTLHGMRNAFSRVNAGNVKKLAEDDDEDDEENEIVSEALRECDLLANCLDRLVRRALAENKRVLVTGHSLGGVLALQLALRSPQHPNLRVYTFGEPEYGDAEFYAKKRWIKQHYHRFVTLTAPPNCEADIVTRITKLFGGGDHFARPIYLCHDLHPPKTTVKAHAMTGYLRAIQDHIRPAVHIDYLRGPALADVKEPLLVEQELSNGTRIGECLDTLEKKSSSRDLFGFFERRRRRQQKHQLDEVTDVEVATVAAVLTN